MIAEVTWWVIVETPNEKACRVQKHTGDGQPDVGPYERCWSCHHSKEEALVEAQKLEEWE
jgi:hypothetical protein